MYPDPCLVLKVDLHLVLQPYSQSLNQFVSQRMELHGQGASQGYVTYDVIIYILKGHGTTILHPHLIDTI